NFFIGKGHIGSAGNYFQSRSYHRIGLLLGYQTRGGAGGKYFGFDLPYFFVDFIKRNHILGNKSIAILVQEQVFYFFKSKSVFVNNASSTVNNPHNSGSHLREIKSSGRTYITKSLNYSSFSFYISAINAVIVPYGFGYSIACNHIGNGIFFGNIRRITTVFNYFDNALAKLPDTVYFIGIGRMEMPCKNAFLRMPNPAIFGHGEYLMNFIYIQVASGAVIGF